MASSDILLWIVLACLATSGVSFSGAFLLFWRGRARAISRELLSFAAGALLGVTVFDILPESLETGLGERVFIVLLGGILFSFLVEKFILWLHHHEDHSETENVRASKALVLFGDGLHNFVDGLAIAASFLVSPQLGTVTTLAVLLHEIPQEWGDFSILVHSGVKVGRALWFNFLSSLTTLLGALLVFYLVPHGTSFEGVTGWLLAFSAGTFLYIAVSDLIPELHRERSRARALLQTVFLFGGIAIIWGVGQAVPGM